VRLAAVLLVGLSLPLAAPVSAAGLFGGNDEASQASRDAAQLTLRIQNLEQQLRDLTGQVQGLQFQLTQMQTAMDRASQDNDFRFKQLEGGGGSSGGKRGGNSDNGDQGSAAPAQLAPPPTTLGGSSRSGRSTDVASLDAGGGSDAAQVADDGQAGDDLGPSADPLVGKGRAGEPGSAEEVPLGPSKGPSVNPAARRTGPGMPVVQQASTGNAAAAQNPAAEADYKIGYNAIVKGDYATAATKFKAFIKQYPDDPQAADATNWLGEALLQQQDYVDAADVLVTGYKSYPNSQRAPDMLLKLGIALGGAQQQDAACKTFGLLSQKYPDTTAAFKTRLKQEMARGKCPA